MAALVYSCVKKGNCADSKLNRIGPVVQGNVIGEARWEALEVIKVTALLLTVKIFKGKFDELGIG